MNLYIIKENHDYRGAVIKLRGVHWLNAEFLHCGEGKLRYSQFVVSDRLFLHAK